MHGATGPGKSHFVVWLAGRLGIPIYNLYLTSPVFQGDSLLRMFSESTLKHWPCLVHLDEFDAAVRMWVSSVQSENAKAVPAYGTSIETFKELLDGGGTMSSGVIVITGMSTEPLLSLPSSEKEQNERRLHKVAHVTPFTTREFQQYVSQYLMAFLVPNVPRSYVSEFSEVFVHKLVDKTIHATKKAIEAFLTEALINGSLTVRQTEHVARSSSSVTPLNTADEIWWEALPSDIREFILPHEVLQGYIAENTPLPI